MWANKPACKKMKHPFEVISKEEFFKMPPEMGQHTCILKSETSPQEMISWEAFCEIPPKVGQYTLAY